jgi:Ca2+-binding RTX toxin-like protein
MTSLRTVLLGTATALSAAVLVVLPQPADAAAGTCFGKAPTITGTGLVRGTPGPDVIVARGAAEVHAYGGDDLVCGAFLVYAGPGDDRVVYTRDGGDYPELIGGSGDDLLVLGGDLFASLDGGRGHDVLRGTRGEQFIVGGPGRDRLLGGAGPDTLIGGTGRDVADGGAGRDSCSSVERRRSC